METDYVKLIITDVDGVLTDGGVGYLSTGGRFRKFSTLDGHGFQLAKEHGVDVAMMTRSNAIEIASRASHLQVASYLSVKDKKKAVEDLAVVLGIDLKSICFVGNDITDIDAMSICGYRACPADAHDYVRTLCSVDGFTSVYNGGHGAFRQLIDWLMLWQFKKVPYPNILFTAESKSD